MKIRAQLTELRMNLISVTKNPDFKKERLSIREAYNTALERLIMLEIALERLKAELDIDPDVIEHLKNVNKD